ncbi:MAG: cobalt ECF transporter T component CbiQ [Spirochaetaceae bacterium]|jgi:cobalt ECF transporter T component CbiQ|nr:cobalt ECF transporter T component CbiQ [Spirochaetaceae bacterium]
MNFLLKTIKSFASVFNIDFFSERYSEKKKLFQCIDPRIKLVVIFAFIIFSSLARDIVVFIMLALSALLYAKLSGLNTADYIRRVWMYVPLFIFIFSLPGGFFIPEGPQISFIERGESTVPFLSNGLYYSKAGIIIALRLALRAGISLSFGFLLLLTTRWTGITQALLSFRIPLVIISILNMTYRYIFVVSLNALDMIEARYLRSVGRLSSTEKRSLMIRSIGSLFIKSHTLSDEIYHAMVCRCFTGTPVTMENGKIGVGDIIFLITNIFILSVLAAYSLLWPESLRL